MKTATVPLLLIVIVAFHLAQSFRPPCQCTAFDRHCWPDSQSWATFNASIDGKLIRVVPPASPCHDPAFNRRACREARQRWSFPFWRADQPGAMQASNWESNGITDRCLIDSPRNSSCSQGSVPIYAVAARKASHIQAAVGFAAARNLRLVVKNTGHDYLGRSTAAGALSIWTHQMKSMRFHHRFLPRGCSRRSKDATYLPAVTVGAGVQWEELYQAVFDRKFVIVGGGSSSVGAAGGHPQGGGHSPLSPTFGLTADNVLEFSVVTADGSLVVANRCQNQDLYWAMRGGGGGTFGIAVTATHRLYPALDSLVFAQYNLSTPDKPSFQRTLARFTELHPSLERAGWAGTFAITNTTGLTLSYLLPNRGMELANATLAAPLEELAREDPQLRSSGSLQSFPSFQEFRLAIQCQGRSSCRDVDTANTGIATAGIPLLLASRLIPRTTVAYSPGNLAEVMVRIRELFPRVSLTGVFVGGGAVSRDDRDNAVNPAWRRALWHVILGSSWSDGDDRAEQRARAELSAANAMLIDLTPGSGAYGNEADFNEPQWQESLFGEHYTRLLAIKKRVDPAGIFRCYHCVGSEEWSEDLLCATR
ncbi:uncharacterized FAD-linked oxidoreductase ARB_02478 [Selaginella moellendorffii]|uniref:uncharacterized FAD-linked oxidoreductase ARB_02478 n=1 Tax=Selaginella moellendorffii TaxID=88036 RepID=UPI000D1C3E96|nr:uncharacterized FAD-linked oxidoreductase ARB_02478 [Selaginella moellendorffii]|eukprot:XP_024516309.1 uncharacterized FAD-linked oxidoreductase ARB_02478 [Selaginella moellendorffii]